MQEINVNELRPHPKNDYFFDDMSGQKWNEFLESVKTSGIIEPIVVTQDKVIVSGHQRVRACKELGISKIKAEVKIYCNEDQVIKDLIETNIRQRGDISSSSLKMGRIICELERIYGIKKGGDRKSSLAMVDQKTQSDIAKELGMSVVVLNRYKKLTTLIPELQTIVDEKQIAASVASRILSRLSHADQKRLILMYGKNKIKNATQAEIQQMIRKMQQLGNTNAELQVEIKNKKEENKSDDENDDEKSILERKVKLNQSEIDRYKKLQHDINIFNAKKDDYSRKIYSVIELAKLSVKIQHMLETDLAPIKFKRCMEGLDSNDPAIKDLTHTVNAIDQWSSDMKTCLLNARKM